MIDLPTALYVISYVYFCCPQNVPAKALRILFLLDTLSATWLLYLLNGSEVSRLTPKIFGHCTRCSCESSMCIFGWVLAWCVSRVNKVTDDVGSEGVVIQERSYLLTEGQFPVDLLIALYVMSIYFPFVVSRMYMPRP